MICVKLLHCIYNIKLNTVLSMRPRTCQSSSSHSVVNRPVFALEAFNETHEVRPTTPQDLLEFFQ